MEGVRPEDPFERRHEELADVQDSGDEAVRLPGVEKEQDEARCDHDLDQPEHDLLRLSGYRLPDAPDRNVKQTVGSALFADLTDEEQEELLEYLAWYRARKRSKLNGNGKS